MSLREESTASRKQQVVDRSHIVVNVILRHEFDKSSLS